MKNRAKPRITRRVAAMLRDELRRGMYRQTTILGVLTPYGDGEVRLDCYAVKCTKAHGVQMTQINRAWSGRDWYLCKDIYRTFMGVMSVSFDERRDHPDIPCAWYDGRWGNPMRWGEGSEWWMPYTTILNPEALEGTRYRYCGFAQYPKGGPVPLMEYLRLYRQYKGVEFLAKGGLSRYISGPFLKRLNGDRRLFAYFRSHIAELRAGDYSPMDVTRAAARGWTLERAHDANLAAVLYRGVPKCVNRIELHAYLKRNGIDRSDYLHYCSLCEEAKTAMDGFGVAFPRDFHRAVQNIGRRVDRERRKADSDREAFLLAVREGTERRLARKGRGLSSGDYRAVFPLRRADFEKEGRMMRNCIGTYFARCADGETGIFFVRRGGRRVADVEYSPSDGCILQCRARFNREADVGVLGFATGIVKVAARACMAERRKVGSAAA